MSKNGQRSVTRTSPGGITETVAADALGSVASIAKPHRPDPPVRRQGLLRVKSPIDAVRDSQIVIG